MTWRSCVRIQDWNLRYALSSVKGVSEVAPVGGFVKQYQVDLDPNALVAYNIPLSEVVNAIKMSNADVGGKTFEVATTEYFIRGRGYIKKIEDIENIVLKVENGTPVYLKNIGTVHLGADIRRGVAELDGKGETVGGIVVMRYGENALNVIDGVKKKIEEIKPSLPEGVRIVPTYDRSDLIKRAIATLRRKADRRKHHRRARLHRFSLARPLVAGRDHHAAHRDHSVLHPDVVDARDLQHHVVRRHRHRDRRDGRFGHHHGRERAQGARAFPRRTRPRAEAIASELPVIIAAAKSVGSPALFLSARHHRQLHSGVLARSAGRAACSSHSPSRKHSRCFSPSFLGVTLVPVLMLLLIRGKITPEDKNPINRFLIRGLPAVRQFRPALTAGSRSSPPSVILRAHDFSLLKTRQRIHAAAQ